jgi:hypothetical protein
VINKLSLKEESIQRLTIAFVCFPLRLSLYPAIFFAPVLDQNLDFQHHTVCSLLCSMILGERSLFLNYLAVQSFDLERT